MTPYPSSAAPFGAIDPTLLANLLGGIPDSVYFKDRESRFLAVSEAKAKKHGLRPADLLGKTDRDTFADQHANVAFDDEQRVIRTGEPIVDKLEKEIWPDGHVTWSLTSKLPLRDAAGAIVGTWGISKDVTREQSMKAELERTAKQLAEASRMAGMAEVATGVLHNVGNVLNSLNVSAMVVTSGLRQSKVDALAKIAALLREHRADLGAFLTADPKGKLVPEFVESLAKHLVEDRNRLLGEIDSLQKNIDHIKDIVAMQQSLATVAGVVEALDPTSLMEDAVRMNTAALARHDVTLERKFQPVPAIRAEKPKVLQILVNLIRNAKYACDDGAPPAKVMTLRVELGPPGMVRMVVADNGVGIPAENLTRIFQHGFTTRKDGHGFGLHSAGNAAREMKGSLVAHSDGPGRGATFTLELPIAGEPAKR